MSRPLHSLGSFIGLLFLASPVSNAHSFGTPYALPLPFWMYVYGCAATLVVTFTVMGLAASTPASSTGAWSRAVHAGTLSCVVGRSALSLLRVGAAACLLLTVLAGFIGTADPGQNIGMTLFWVVFLLGFAYLTLFLGDLYALINPWKWGIEALERVGFDLSTPRVTYWRCVGYWPAFLSYLLLIWLELFIGLKPLSLSIALIIYSALTFIGVALVGKAVWFCQADVFSVFFRLIGKLAPTEYTQRTDGTLQVRLRPPLTGALHEPPDHLSIVLFVLLMLSSTTYDALHDTALWTGLYWRNLLWLLQPLWGEDLGKAQRLLMGGYLAYRQAGLCVFPFVYFGFYLLVLWWAKALARTATPLRSLALHFCYSLIPIAVAYNFTHYYTFLITQIHRLPGLISDPFGLGWSLPGIEPNSTNPVLPMGFIWHTQVVVLLGGHMGSVYLTHKVAMNVFPTRRQIMVSQLPLLTLMIAYTTFGLWILSLPLGSIGG